MRVLRSRPDASRDHSVAKKVIATVCQTARATLGCVTDRSLIKMHHLERYTGPEWHVHAYNRI